MRFLFCFLLVVMIAAAPPPRLARADEPATLENALEKTAWNVSARGPLLVVDAANTRRWTPPVDATLPPEVLPPPPALPPLGAAGGWNLNIVAPYFGRKVVATGSVSVVAPILMTVLNPKPGAPNLLADLKSNELHQMLFASLTPAQWKLLGSARGIGAGDLSAVQRDLFWAYLPDPITLRRVPASKQGVRNTGGTVSVLTNSQRAVVRLRFGLDVFLRLRSADKTKAAEGSGIVLPRFSLPEGEETVLLANPGRDYIGRTRAFGVALIRELPNRAKESQLVFDAPALKVPIALREREALGDLVARIGKTCGLELHADARVASLVVSVRGEAAQAGDVLRALCLGVTGTFRRVESVYVLTDDIEGIGARVARLMAWGKAADARRRAKTGTPLRQQIAAQKPLQYLDFAADDPLSPGPKLAKQLKTSADFELSGVPVADLPPGLRAVVRAAAAAETPRRGGPFRADVVDISEQLRLSYLVPGVGAVEADDFIALFGPEYLLPAVPETEKTPPGPVALPATMGVRALRIAPQNADEAGQAAARAKARGLNQLWVTIALDEPDAPARLADAVAAGKKYGLSVVAAARLLSRPPDLPATSDDERDVNILGETTHESLCWLRPDAPGVAARLRAQLVALAQTPGLAGLMLEHTAAPGYEETGTEKGALVWGPGPDWGHTPAARLAFLRETHTDPVDLNMESSFVTGVGLRLPFFPPSDSLRVRARDADAAADVLGRWNRFRHARGARLLADLFAALRAAAPALPLLLAERSDGAHGAADWYGSWDRADALFQRAPGGGQAKAARATSRRIFLNVPVVAPYFGIKMPGSSADYGRTLRKRLGENTAAAWDGVVLDLSALPVEKALPLLNAVSAPGG